MEMGNEVGGMEMDNEVGRMEMDNEGLGFIFITFQRSGRKA